MPKPSKRSVDAAHTQPVCVPTTARIALVRPTSTSAMPAGFLPKTTMSVPILTSVFDAMASMIPGLLHAPRPVALHSQARSGHLRPSRLVRLLSALAHPAGSDRNGDEAATSRNMRHGDPSHGSLVGRQPLGRRGLEGRPGPEIAQLAGSSSRSVASSDTPAK